MRPNVMLRNLNLSVAADDERRVEVLAQGLPCFGGAQLAVDVTAWSALTTRGTARPRATWQNGAALLDARQDKEATYPELVHGSRVRLVVLALETAGRASRETVDFLWQLALARARSSPTYLQRAAAYGWFRRWSRLLAVTLANCVAASLLDEKDELAALPPTDGPCPWLLDLLAEARHSGPVRGADAPADGLLQSRLPLRSQCTR